MTSGPANEVADRKAALALLSFTAARLWELRDRRFRHLTRSAYDAMGPLACARATLPRDAPASDTTQKTMRR